MPVIEKPVIQQRKSQSDNMQQMKPTPANQIQRKRVQMESLVEAADELFGTSSMLVINRDLVRVEADKVIFGGHEFPLLSTATHTRDRTYVRPGCASCVIKFYPGDYIWKANLQHMKRCRRQ